VKERPVGGGGRLQHLDHRAGLLSIPILRGKEGRLERVRRGWFCRWLIRKGLEEKIYFQLL